MSWLGLALWSVARSPTCALSPEYPPRWSASMWRVTGGRRRGHPAIVADLPGNEPRVCHDGGTRQFPTVAGPLTKGRAGANGYRPVAAALRSERACGTGRPG